MSKTWQIPALALLSGGLFIAATPGLARAESYEVNNGADLDPATQDVSGEIAVDLRDDATETDISDLARQYGLALRPNSIFSGPEKLEIAKVSPADEARLLEQLSRDPRVEHVEPMAIYRTSFVPNDPLYAEKQWHLKRVGAEKAWEYGCGEGVTVAVIDTGVACYDKGPFSRGSDLAGTRCGDGYNFVNDTPEAYDDQGHGTHVAGTIAQTTNNEKGVAGLAYCSRLMPVKVLNRYGWGTLADVAEGIRYAADHGAQVINMSLGGPSSVGILKDAVEHALSKGVIVVAAAGNSGKAVGYPAAYPGVIAVSATDQNDKIAWFSSRGPQVAIGAPGVAVTQQTICEGGRNKCEIFGTFNGTSMASPHVAGSAAMLVGLGVTEPGAVRRALERGATPKDEPQLYGAGVLDTGKSIVNAYWTHVAARLAALFAVFLLVSRRIKKVGGEVASGPGVLFGALLAGVGLLPFAPLLGLASHAGPMRWLVELAMRPLGEWDLVLGTSMHRWLPLASALPTMALTAFFFGAKRLRPTIGGFAVGSAALLTTVAIFADVAFPLGGILLRVWTVLNALVCVWVARITLDKKAA
ncbi:S8 family peptidase [Pendulispora brunnea]|uniref:S8 family peptidase n=1 Tax=Pendulispora brunnea TaxID=2905690 RepID=A0ABZ2KHF3_9BACT